MSARAVPPDAPRPFVVREARADERDAVRALTRAAYAEYAHVMTPDGYAALDGAIRAALDAAPSAGATVLVAVRPDDAREDGRDDGRDDAPPAMPLGSVHLFPPASDAYAGLAAPPRWPELRLLAAAPAARGLGVGRALVEACAARARAAGAAALGLHTSRSMVAARALYARLGFVRDPAHDILVPGAELVEGYRLALDGAPARDA